MRATIFLCIVSLLLIASIASLSAQETIVKSEIHKIFANGQWLAYEDKGNGPPIVLVHGTMADFRVWFNQIEPFSRRGRVIAYSRRYDWPNTLPGSGIDGSVPRQVEDLAAVIRGLGIAPVHLVGHSYGGQLSLFLALQHPDLVRSLVVAEPIVFSILANIPGAEADLKANQDFVSGVLRPALSSGNSERIVNAFLGYVAPGDFDHFRLEIQRVYVTNVPGFKADVAGAFAVPFSCDDARRISVATLVVASDGAPNVYRRTTDALSHCVVGSNLVTIPRTTHLMFLDNPQAFNEAVLTFVAKH
jgi:non-heme chloroperoxidase